VPLHAQSVDGSKHALGIPLLHSSVVDPNVLFGMMR
jgi:hypothetical protein